MILTFSESEYKSVGKNSGENVNDDKAQKDLALQPRQCRGYQQQLVLVAQ